MKASSVVREEAQRAPMPTGTAAYFVLGEGGYAEEVRQGRQWTSIHGVPLENEREVRLALAKDGEVWSQPPAKEPTL